MFPLHGLKSHEADFGYLYTSVITIVIFKKMFHVISNRYLSCITGKIYNNELFVNVMPMDGSSSIFKKPTSILSSRMLHVTTLQTNFPSLCLCNLVKLDETFRVWWSWVGIINYTIKIVLVFDGFFNYHFEPCQNMKNSLFVFGF